MYGFAVFVLVVAQIAAIGTVFWMLGITLRRPDDIQLPSRFDETAVLQFAEQLREGARRTTQKIVRISYLYLFYVLVSSGSVFYLIWH